MDWTLERVNVPRNFIVLDKSERSYPCGRGQNNKIICPSLVVSRRHCIFVRTDDVISVIDLGSSNGIYVNHQKVASNELVELNENDIIGIGALNEYTDEEPMFVYKLHKGNLNSRNLEDFDELLTQRSSASSVNAQPPKNPAPYVSSANQTAAILKRNLPDKIEEKKAPVVPHKVQKLSNGFHKVSDVVGTVKPSSSAKASLPEPPEVEEIEEIWSTLTPHQISKPKTSSAQNGQDKSGSVSSSTNRLTLNIESDEEGKKPSSNVKLVNGESACRCPKSSSKKEISRGAFALPKQRKSEEASSPPSTERVKSEVQQATKVISSQESSHKTFRFSLDASSSATRFTVDILESNGNEQASLSPKENGEAIRRRSDSPGGLKKKKTKKTGREERRKSSESSAQVEATANPMKNNVETNRQSFLSKDPVAASTPFKLKAVKQEPMTSFSIFDTVNLSDDDDDIFPCSQLFDSTAESNSVKLENGGGAAKAENVIEEEEEEDNKNFFREVEAVIRESEEIITLSDSEDEDVNNPWLHRLSESQRIKEEEPEINKVEIERPETPEMEFVDELFLEIKRDLPEKPKTEKKIEDVEVPKEPKDKTRPKSESRSISKSPRPMTLSEIEKDVNDYKEDEDELDYDKPSTSEKSPSSSKERKKSLDVDSSIKINQGTPKGPKIIEPLRLPQRKRLSFKESNDAGDSAQPSTSKGRVKVRDCSVKVPKLPCNLTTKQKRELQMVDRVKQKKYEEEQRIRRIKNKWAQNVPLPVGRRSSPPISKKQKAEIVNDRKAKLKALATKQKLNSVEPSVERPAAKVKAKVSTKNRGDFLINEQVGSLAKTVTEEAAQASTSRKEPKSPKKNKPKNLETTGKSTGSKETITSEKGPGVERERKEESEGKKKTKEKKRSEKRSESVERGKRDSSVTTATASKPIESLNQKENRVPNSVGNEKKKEEDKDKAKKKKKKVSFSDNLFTVREYQISPNNTMRKCVGKDALIPKDKLARVRKADKSQNPRLEEFLLQIFQWNPSWLEEQKHLKTEPPIVNNDTLVPLLTKYKSYQEYYQILMPLLLLELWHGITKEFESIDKNNRRPTVSCSIVNNSVTFQPIPSTNTSLTTMLLELLASEEDIRRQIHPVYGDLVLLELCYKNDAGKQNFLKVFAYVTQLYRAPITPNTFFNRDLMNYTANPTRVLTYTVLTRPLKVQLCINRVLRLRCVTYLRANMRMVQALQSLPSSPLLQLIIDPRSDRFSAPGTTKQQSNLVTKDNLNPKQLEAVLKTTEAIVRKEPKLCLIQGPPGTGKSEVIVNMVMQVLYGDNRYRSKESSLRILLCAPSNAAIDEIVLRLLDRRAKLTNDRFRMVRVGLLGPMHPRVREISVEELAKRDVKQTINSYQTCVQSTNSIEDEKRYLEARMNALKSKLNSPQQVDANEKQFTNMKLMEVKARYDLINTCTQSNGNNVNPQDLMKLQRGAENKILIGADIIACTLSSCYTNLMESIFGGTQQNISVCIVDEATQSCEAETLIPLMLGVNTLVLVGDPAQLPATIISQRAKHLGLDQSLFSRAQRAFEGTVNSPVIMLDVQYRMDVHISYWPNMYFYGGKLKNGAIREHPVLPFHPYRVLNLDSFQNSDKFSNTQEAEFVANLIYGMITHLDAKKTVQQVNIGVITPYRNQLTLVQAKINQRILPIIDNLKVKVITEVNTVDSFQGHERDIIIMSCVRTNGIGFLSDPQRLCVALTRAKHCLVMCGNFGTFQRDTMWRALLADARSRRSYIEIKSESRPSEIVSKLVR